MNANKLFNKIFGAVIFFLPGLALVSFSLYARFSGNEDAIEGGPNAFVGLLVFGLVFMGIGYVQINDAARLSAIKKFSEWNRNFGLGFISFLVVGLAAFYMAYLEEPIYLIFGFTFTLVGGLGLFWLYWKAKRKAALPKTGQKLECADIVVEQVRGANGFWVPDQDLPFVIKCSALEPATNLPFVFVSEPVWFDPKPYIVGAVFVYVNPQNFTEYWMDTSFLPKK